MEAKVLKYRLLFRFDAGTSRGVLRNRNCWFLIVQNSGDLSSAGIGECAPIPGLSFDRTEDFEKTLLQVCQRLNEGMECSGLNHFPAIRFGLEMALKDYETGADRILFQSDFTKGKVAIPINGLVWMGSHDFMKQQIREKISAGFDCIKVKIGSLDFEEELSLIRYVRNEFSADDIMIRVDANGAFHPDEAPEKLKRLAEFELHSIEQPIAAGQRSRMASLCHSSPLPIALDEELTGIHGVDEKKKLIETIKPAFIILKPTLLGGFAASREWIKIAEENKIGWWVTSALESNIGLNAIAQWTYSLQTDRHQGLGTGQLYHNNFESPLFIRKGKLHFHPSNKWDLSALWNG